MLEKKAVQVLKRYNFASNSWVLCGSAVWTAHHQYDADASEKPVNYDQRPVGAPIADPIKLANRENSGFRCKLWFCVGVY